MTERMTGAVLATPGDRARVIETILAAFAGDPAFRYFFGDDQDARSSFAAYLFDIRAPSRSVWLIDGGASVALWDPPPDPGLEPRLEPVNAELPKAIPAAARHRLAGYDKAIHGNFPSTPFWYLGVLATHPEYAGRRLGRAVMRPGLQRAKADGVPAYLETATPHNVDLYRRSGWGVVQSLTVAALDVWILRHEGL